MEGSEVAQVYVTYPDVGYTTPAKQLKGFAKASNVKPKESRKLEVSMDKYAVSSWHEPSESWVMEPGVYTIHVGFNSADLILKGEFTLTERFFWKGL
jgi:beta-glucosidase